MNTGKIIQVIGPVVDVAFEPVSHLSYPGANVGRRCGIQGTLGHRGRLFSVSDCPTF